ncbi:uncharacterized protein LOC123331726 isoform X4 [Bubalus bubalis]|uniref:uncharacterized protein LOC123331726 isoform X4 n=1 Tax=Bubalus bubalis TaxID=89462 RepID=UPI001D123C81|nr:uncharacterized protein LOC123331726 isoform X4 [Bubalus bubalis]XP_044792541.1 uncharacterized protein LOC123331726 isoform X4 [Bubalus bubalis]
MVIGEASRKRWAGRRYSTASGGRPEEGSERRRPRGRSGRGSKHGNGPPLRVPPPLHLAAQQPAFWVLGGAKAPQFAGLRVFSWGEGEETPPQSPGPWTPWGFRRGPNTRSRQDSPCCTEGGWPRTVCGPLGGNLAQALLFSRTAYGCSPQCLLPASSLEVKGWEKPRGWWLSRDLGLPIEQSSPFPA